MSAIILAFPALLFSLLLADLAASVPRAPAPPKLPRLSYDKEADTFTERRRRTVTTYYCGSTTRHKYSERCDEMKSSDREE